MKDNQDHFNVLRKIQNRPNSTQRELAEELGFSLGKLNYCLRALQNKGLVKIENFKKNPNKCDIHHLWVVQFYLGVAVGSQICHTTPTSSLYSIAITLSSSIGFGKKLFGTSVVTTFRFS